MSERGYPVVVPDTDYWKKMIKCQAACPVNTDARGYVTAVARGDLALGYEIAHDPNPLSTICGRICGAPCEVTCRRGDVGPDFKSVAIRPLKRVLTERFGPEADGTLPRDGGQASSTPISSPIPLFTRTPKPSVTQPGLGPEQPYNRVRWSRENLKALVATPGRHIGHVAIRGGSPP